MSIADQITKAWNNANATVDQYALKAKKAPKSSDLQGSLFETSQQPALPGHGGWNEEAHPRVAKGSQQAHGGQFTSKDAANPTIANEQGPIPLRERKSFAEAMANQGKTSAEIADAMVKRGIALSDANRLANGAVGAQQKPVQKVTDNGRSDDALDDWTNSDEFAEVMNESPRLKSLDQAASKEIEQGLTGEDGTPAIGPKEKAYLSEMVTAMETAGHDVPEIVKQKIGYQPKPKPDRPALEVSKPAENSSAKSGDQMGLFGEVANVKPEKPGFKPTLLDQAKQPPLFDTKGDPDQIMMFDDGVTPEDRLLKAETKTEAKPKKAPTTELPEGWSESSPGGMAIGPNKEIVDKVINSDEWFVIHSGQPLDGFKSRDEAVQALKNYKPESLKSSEVDRKPGESMEQPSEPAEAPVNATPSEEANSERDKAIDSGKTPRQAAQVAQKKIDEDYEFARASDIRNAGEDLKGSARHKVNAWKGLAEAEKDGTAAEFMTRKSLLKVEPHNLMASITDTHAMSHLVAHGALSGFPDSPGSYPANYSKYRDRMGNPLSPPKSAGELRKQYHASYMAIKDKAEKLATSEVDARAVSRGISEEVKRQINICRGLPTDASGTATFNAKDPYNPVANGLVSLANRAAGGGRKKTDLMNRVLEVVKHAHDKYGAAPTRDHLAMIKEHAIDLMDGKSMNKTFGLESRAVKRFDPSEAYVKHATRKGGRDLSNVTSNANKATKHMVDSMGLRGVQWGNSVTDDERKHHAAKAVEALTDLADVTGLHPKDIALDGKLGLAIGARGKGNASAHYEPGTQVVNLTRASGVGALAHEWGHAFDHMLEDFSNSSSSGNYMSRNFGAKPGDGKGEIRSAYAKWWDDSAKYRIRLSDYLRSQVREGGMSAKKANDYWNSGHEIFARTFERHIEHKLAADGKQNTYLAGLSGSHPLWPTDEETSKMADAFDGILTAYRKHKHGSAEKVKFSRREAIEAFSPVRFRPSLLNL